MAVKKIFATIVFSLFCLAVHPLQAEALVFSGTPAAGSNFLCTFALKKNINRKMEIRGAENPPQQVLADEFYLSGKLQITEKNDRALLFQFAVDSFSWLEEGKKQTLNGTKTVDFAMDIKGNLRMCRYSAESDPAQAKTPVPHALQNALLQLGRSLLTGANDVLGPDSSRNVGDFWTASDQLINTLAKNRNISPVNKNEWDSKVLFTRQDTFFQTPVNRIDFNLITNRIPGYDCRINMTYLFPVDSPETTGALSYVLDWMECVDKIMPENNPVFSGTKIVEVMTMTIRRDLIPIQ